MALIYGRPVNMTAVGGVLAAAVVAGAGGYLLWRWIESRQAGGRGLLSGKETMRIRHAGFPSRPAPAAVAFEGNGFETGGYYDDVGETVGQVSPQSSNPAANI